MAKRLKYYITRRDLSDLRKWLAAKRNEPGYNVVDSIRNIGKDKDKPYTKTEIIGEYTSNAAANKAFRDFVKHTKTHSVEYTLYMRPGEKDHRTYDLLIKQEVTE